MKEIDKRALQEWEIFRENIRRETPVEQLSEAEKQRKKTHLEAHPVEWMKYFFPNYASCDFAPFQVASIITTTGFATADFNLWSQTSKLTLVLLMFIGACAGSTGGGIKVSRLVIAGKTVRKEIGSYVHPKSIKKIQMDGKPIEHDVVRSTNVYFMTYLALFSLCLFLISFEGRDIRDFRRC